MSGKLKDLSKFWCLMRQPLADDFVDLVERHYHFQVDRLS